MTSKTNTLPEPEVFIVDDHIDGVSCDGGGGALGHPKTWYSFDGQDCVECMYCDRVFVKARYEVAYMKRQG